MRNSDPPFSSIRTTSATLGRFGQRRLTSQGSDDMVFALRTTYTEVLEAYGMHTLRITIVVHAPESQDLQRPREAHAVVERWEGPCWREVFRLEGSALESSDAMLGDVSEGDLLHDRTRVLGVALSVLMGPRSL